MDEPDGALRTSLVTPEAITALLWDNDWRARMVRRVDIDRARVYREHLSLQSSPLREWLISYSAPPLAETVEVVIPLDTLPKRPLVNFSVEGPSTQCFLLKRGVIAELETDFIEAVGSEFSVEMSSSARRLCRAICEFTPALFTQVSDDLGGIHDRSVVTREYLRRNLPLELSESQFRDLLRRTEKIGVRLREKLGEPSDVLSSGDNPILALPLAFDDVEELNAESLEATVAGLELYVESCEATAFDDLHPLALMASYGRRWEMMVQVKVPVDEPFVIRASRDVPTQVERWGWLALPFRFNDSLSNHVSIKLLDPEIRFAAVHALDLNGQKVQSRNFVTFERSREDISAYGSERSRLLDLVFQVKLATSGTYLLSYWAFAAIMVGATALLFIVKPLTSDLIAVLVVPTTFAAAFLLAQQRTSLTSLLQRGVRRFTIIILLTMWVALGILYIIQRAQP